MKYFIFLPAVLLLVSCGSMSSTPAQSAKASAEADCRGQADQQTAMHGFTTPADKQMNKMARDSFVTACLSKKGY